MSLFLADLRCGREPDGAWWVHSRGEADWDVVEAPGRRRRSWSRFKDLHRPPGPTQSHDAGKTTKSSAINHRLNFSLKVCLNLESEQRSGENMENIIWVSRPWGVWELDSVEEPVETLILLELSPACGWYDPLAYQSIMYIKLKPAPVYRSHQEI